MNVKKVISALPCYYSYNFELSYTDKLKINKTEVKESDEDEELYCVEPANDTCKTEQ